MRNNPNTTKVQMVTDHFDYKKGQIIELEENQAINFLTNGKALRIHREKTEIITEQKDEISEDKANKKSKKND